MISRCRGSTCCEQRHRPGLKRLGQQACGWCRLKACVRDAPRPRPRSGASLVDQQAHQLGHGDRRVGVVELDGGLVPAACSKSGRSGGGDGAGCPAASRRRRRSAGPDAARLPLSVLSFGSSTLETVSLEVRSRTASRVDRRRRRRGSRTLEAALAFPETEEVHAAAAEAGASGCPRARRGDRGSRRSSAEWLPRSSVLCLTRP
jgi:hypothetical protein